MSEFEHLWIAQRRARKLRVLTWVLTSILVVAAFILGCLWLGDQLDLLSTSAGAVIEQLPDSDAVNLTPAERELARMMQRPE